MVSREAVSCDAGPAYSAPMRRNDASDVWYHRTFFCNTLRLFGEGGFDVSSVPWGEAVRNFSRNAARVLTSAAFVGTAEQSTERNGTAETGGGALPDGSPKPPRRTSAGLETMRRGDGRSVGKENVR